ncbi:TetR/AcrR family transcriptional regulator [Ideonella sp. YS5]|uniref:TetR/AcrR family transcriptional regulator n=1 Tax=Ideonella sp. YS5 TaxID=3453714 RepID=UPI003EE8DAE8
MSRTPNARKEETHERILEVASQALRQQGYDGVGVADVMKKAGLTHGGFYAHFGSREVLLAEALERAGRDSLAAVGRAAAAGTEQGASAFRALVEAYLDPAHADAPASGCPVAALGSEMARQSPALRQASAARVQALVGAVRATLPRGGRSAALAVASTLVGALQLARALGDGAEGRAALAAARKALIQQYDEPYATPP